MLRYNDIAGVLTYALTSSPDIGNLRETFLFNQLPILADQPLQMLANSGVITILGNLSAIWGGGHSDRRLSREWIRTCQELGINILHYAAQRHQIMQTMQVNPKYINSSAQPVREQRRITNMYI